MSAVVHDPRKAVLLQISLAHDRFVALERREWKNGHTAEATGAHAIAMGLLRAYMVEDKDPKPKDLP